MAICPLRVITTHIVVIAVAVVVGVHLLWVLVLLLVVVVVGAAVLGGRLLNRGDLCCDREWLGCVSEDVSVYGRV